MDRTDLLEKTHSKVSDMLKYSEAKNISIIAVNSAVFILYTTILKIIYPDISVFISKKIQLSFYIFAIILLFISSFVSLFSIIPKYIRTKTYIDQKRNYIFYADINKESQYVLLKKYDEYIENISAYDSDLCQSIFSISKITSKKNNLFLFSCCITLFSAAVYVLFYILYLTK